MEKSKAYQRTYFNANVLAEAIAEFDKTIETVDGTVVYEHDYFRVSLIDETWKYDNMKEFIADYRKGTNAGFTRRRDIRVDGIRNEFCLDLEMYKSSREMKISVSAPERPQIESVFEVFEMHVANSRLPEPEKEEEEKVAPTIFIGHGHSEVWRDLKDHLHEQHHYPVEAYETGARVGHAIRNILESMMLKSAFALLVLTCDDDVGDGKYRARQNVIHETGLFQGRLGFSRAIILLEDGVDLEDFSNIEGIHQIRFSKDNIKETFGDVLATIQREIGGQD